MESRASDDVVLVTGSSGLIGSAVVRCLAGEGYRVFGLDMVAPDQPLPSEAEHLEMRIDEDASVRAAVAQVRQRWRGPVASVIHLAAYYDFAGQPSEKYEQVTLRGSERLLAQLRDLPVQQFVFSSTMLVYRPTRPGRPLREDHPLEPRWAYPISKVEAEKAIRQHRGKIPTVFLRISGVYTDQCDSIPISQQIARIREKQLTARVFPGNIQHGQAWVHLDDLVEAIRLTVQRRHELDTDAVILIGEPVTYSYDQIQRELARLLHGEADWTTQEIPKAVAKAGAWVQGKIPGVEEPFIKPWMIDMADDHYELNIDRAHALLGWQPQRRLIDTLPRMVEALRRDPAGWYEHHKLESPEEKG